jgi:hypothetical protein
LSLSSISGLKHKSKSRSSSKSRRKRHTRGDNAGNYNASLDPNVQAQINKLPKGFYELPQHVLYKMPSLNNDMQQFAQQQPMQGFMQPPPMQGYVQPQPMQGMMQGPVMQQPMQGFAQQTMQQPMYGNGMEVPQQMYNMQGGGKEQPKYKLVNDKNDKDFFF